MALRHRIHDAAKRGSIEDVESLLNDNPDLVNDKGEDLWTPLFRAAYNGRLPLVEVLVERGASLGRDADEWQNSPLHACCINGHREVAEYLVGKGADIDEKDNVGGWTPLFTASYFGWPELVKLLMEHGADASSPDREGKKPLDVACLAGYRTHNKAVIQALLQNLPVPKTVVPSPPRPRSSDRLVAATSTAATQLHGPSGAAASVGGAPVRLSISGLSSPITTSPITISNPPPYREARSGSRLYFPWELDCQDYARRGLDLLQDLLLSLFKGAMEVGVVAKPLPHPSNPFKPYLDAYDLVELAVKHQAELEEYLVASAEKEEEQEDDEGERQQQEEEEENLLDGSGGSGGSQKKKPQTFADKLQAVGVTMHRASHCHDDVERLLEALRVLAAHVERAGGGGGAATGHVEEDVQDLKDQFDAHYHSRRERLRFLRVTFQDEGSLSSPAVSLRSSEPSSRTTGGQGGGANHC